MAESAISVDGTRTEATVTAAAAGVYDPEKQLTAEGIIALKDTLNADEWLVAEVCGHIVVEMFVNGYVDESEISADEDSMPFIGEDGRFADEREFGHRIGSLAAYWGFSLQRALTLPGSEWPEGMSPPATFSEALKEVAARGTNNG